MLGRNFQIAAHMVLYQLFHIFGRFIGQVIAQARCNQHLFDTAQLAGAAIDFDQRVVIGRQVLANAGVDTAGFAARRFDLGRFAAQAVHIGSGAAQIADHARKALHLVAHVFHFFDDAFFAAALDDAALVLGDRAKSAAAKAAAHDVDAKANHLPGGDFRRAIMPPFFIGIGGVRVAGVGQVKHPIHLGRGQRNRRRVHPHIARGCAFAMGLHQGAGVAWVGF